MDDLDKFKENPDGFVKMVSYAIDSFKDKKEQSALYKRVYEDDRCLITMPKGPKGAAAAGSLLKKDGVAVCPWCVAIKYPENKQWWTKYKARAVFFVYSKRKGVVSNAWCMVLNAGNCTETLRDTLHAAQVEDIQNKGNGGNPE